MDWQTVTFQYPWALWGLLLLPLLGWWLVRLKRRQWQQAILWNPVGVAQHLKLRPSPLKRLVEPLTLLGTLVFLLVGLARPTALMKVPTYHVDMMMVLDISLSMMAQDIQPTRLQAATQAGVRFVESLPEDTRIGLALFSGNTYVVTPPVGDHEKVKAFLKSLKVEDLQPRTEIGSAIQSALQALAFASSADSSQQAPVKKSQKVIVLLSDGDSHEGYPWNQAALNAKKQQVQIHTVGIGSSRDTTIVYQHQVLPVTFSEGVLRQIATLSGGSYFRVFREKDFQHVYQAVRDRSLVVEERREEWTVWWVGLALVWLLVGQGLLLFWVKRFP